MSLPTDEFKRIRRVTTGKLLVSKNSIANINSKKIVTPANRRTRSEALLQLLKLRSSSKLRNRPPIR